MRIGVPRETKAEEWRVGLTPAAAHQLVQDGHQLCVERGAGEGSGFADEEYRAAGCALVGTEEAWACELVVKVKEPQPGEYRFFRPDLTLFGYLHLAPAPELTEEILRTKMTAIALETVRRDDGRLPLLEPMSQIAGRLAAQVGAYYLQRPHGRAGILPGGIPGVPRARMVVIGGGTVGQGALRVAVGLGCAATVVEIDPDRLRQLEEGFGDRVQTLSSQPILVAEAVREAHILVGAVLVPGARAPRVVSAEMVRTMRPGAVIVDVAVDQGGCVETADRVTTHSDPVYERYGVLHYAVANMPAAVPRTATQALSAAVLPYVRALAARGWRRAVREDPALARGVNAVGGVLCCAPVAQAQGRPWTELAQVVDAR